MFHMFICFNNITETRENATLHDIITFFQISFFSGIDAFIHYETKKIREYCQAAIQSRYFKKVSQMGRARKKQSCFDNNWTNFKKILILTLNSSKFSRYNRLKLCFFIFLFVVAFFYCQFFKEFRCWMGALIALLCPKWKITVFRYFLLIFSKKRASSKLFSAHH